MSAGQTLPATTGKCRISNIRFYIDNERFRINLYHFGRPDDFTRGVNPSLNRFRDLLMFTMLNTTRLKKDT